MTAIIDYGAGNIASVKRAFAYLGADTFVAEDPDALNGACAAVLPGVGAFGHASDVMRKNGMYDAIKSFAESGKPLLGICLGMQLLFSQSRESPERIGLGVMDGDVLRFENRLKVPQIGHNLVIANEKSRLFSNLPTNSYFYFVHSYYCSVTDSCAICSKSYYGIEFDSALEKENIFAVQFHPEKSGAAGLRLLENFLRIAGDF